MIKKLPQMTERQIEALTKGLTPVGFLRDSDPVFLYAAVWKVGDRHLCIHMGNVGEVLPGTMVREFGPGEFMVEAA